MKHWNLGNTTVRNPDRIRDGLKVLKKYFEGKPFTEKEQLEFHKKLLAEGVIESKDGVRDRSNKISGRKWASCFNQLGFARAWKSKGNVMITDAGNALLDEHTIDEEIFLRQFLKCKLPSEIESGKEYEGFKVIPFYVILKLLDDLKKEGVRGITKDELSLYAITCIYNEDIESCKNKIENYRKEYGQIKGCVKKRVYYFKKKKELISNLYKDELDDRKKIIKVLRSKYQDNHNYLKTKEADELLKSVIASGKGSNTKRAQEFKKYVVARIKADEIKEIFEALLELFMNTKGKTLNDYADTTVRYTVKTGLLSISGDKLIIKADKELLVEKLLRDISFEFEGNYLNYYYSPSLPYLPSDNISFLNENIEQLERRREGMVAELNIVPEEIAAIRDDGNVNRLKKYQNDLEGNIHNLREELFYREQSKEEVIEETLEYFDKIADRSLLGGEAYRPAYLEWTTWRVFLAINSISNQICKTRNFNIDEEMNPIHHAKAGHPDMVFEYDDFVIVCEVTLRTTENQWSEEEPVPRHVAKVVEQHEGKEVYGVFIAPTIDPNTTVEFFRKQRVINGALHEVNIIPFTIDQIKALLVKFGKTRFTTSDFKSFLKSIVEMQKETENPLEWNKMLYTGINEWASC